jgi:2-hydroxy-6-oxonona-2,4-dienedioate hydrolase
MPEAHTLDSYPEHVQTLDDLALLEKLSKRHALAYNGGELVFRSWGAGKPVVLLHGGSGSWNHWARNIAALVRAERQVWIPDLPGFGGSATPLQGQDADALPEPLEWAIMQMIGDVNVDLVGFSFGSMVAALLAQRRPHRVDKLVLIGAPALGVSPKRPFTLRPWLDQPEGEARDRVHRHNLGVLMFSSDAAVDELAITIHGMNLARDRMQRRRLAYTDILLRTIQAIETPIYGIWGEKDVLYLNLQAALAKQLATAKNLQSLQFIEGAGHWVQYEAAAVFDTALNAVLGAALQDNHGVASS